MQRAGALLLGLLAVAGAGFVPARGAPDDPLPDLSASPFEWKDAAQWKGEHYRVTSNSGPEFAALVGRRLELFYRHFFELFRDTPVRLHDVENQNVFVFHRREDFQEYMRKNVAGSVDRQAFFFDKTNTVYVPRAVTEGRETTFETLYHEATHQLMNNAANRVDGMHRCPGFWISEGLATYHEGLREEGGSLVPGFTRRLECAAGLLQRSELLPVADFVRVLHADYHGGHYDQGWALTHYLLHAEEGRWRKPFFAYVRLVIQGRGKVETFKECFGREPSEFDAPLRDYIASLAARERDVAGGAPPEVRPEAPDRPLPEPPSAEGAPKALARVARDLARAGLAGECRHLAEILGELGVADRERAALLAEADRNEKKGSERSGELAAGKAAEAIREQAALLAAELAAMPEAERGGRARLVLRLDGDCAAARRALGHARDGEAWVSPESAPYREGRARFVSRLAAARRMEVPIEAVAGVHPFLVGTPDEEVSAFRFGTNVQVHANLPPDRLRRILTETLRATAFASMLLDGPEAAPSPVRPMVFFLTDSPMRFEALLEAAARAGALSPEKANAARRSSSTSVFRDGQTLAFLRKRNERDAEVSLLAYMFKRTLWGRTGRPLFGSAQPCLQAGILNLAANACFGQNISTLADPAEDPTDGVGDPVASRLSWLLPRAGLAGIRFRMLECVRDGSDPPFEQAMTTELAEVRGEALYKATSVAQMLFERGDLARLLRETWPDAPEVAGRPLPEVFAAALGADLASLESEWKGWLTADRTESPGLVAMLNSDGGRGDPDEALAFLRRRRAEAKVDPVSLAAELSDGAAKHARYLAANPDADPAVEDPRRPGFRPEGAWAGLHSLVAAGVSSPNEAIDRWLGAVHHRVPLLNPGLLHVGWGSAGGFAVLDVDSARFPPKDWTVLWPPDGAADVPLGHAPELPAPVPGADPGGLGYPITLMYYREGHRLCTRVELTLREKGEKGAVVPCHFLAPEQAGAPEFGPEGAWCLIPKGPLKGGTHYFVHAIVRNPGDEIRWSFRTRRGDR